MNAFRTRIPLLSGALVFAIATGCGPAVPTVDIAAILPLTGEAAVYGEDIRNGIVMRHEELLAGAEGLGYNVALNVVDSESDPEQAASLLDEAFSSSLAAIGGVTSAEALAMVSVAEEADRVMLSPSASSPALSGASEFFYRLFPSSEVEASTMATFLRDRLNVQRLAVVAEDSAFGRSLADSIEAVWETALVGKVTFTAGSDQNAMVEEALAQQADCIYVGAAGAALAEAIQALRLAGYSGGDRRIATSSALMVEAVMDAAGPAANGVYLTSPVWEPESPEGPALSFIADYEGKYGSTPSYYAGLGYDAMSIYIAALSEVEAINVPSDFLKGMRAVREYPGVTGTIQFRESGDVQKFTRIYQIVEGNPVDFEKYWDEVRKERVKEMERLQRQIEQLQNR